jgi:hypothetical protein
MLCLLLDETDLHQENKLSRVPGCYNHVSGILDIKTLLGSEYKT